MNIAGVSFFAAQHRRVSIAGADESTTLPDPPGAAIAA
jgi:hypothetical protein